MILEFAAVPARWLCGQRTLHVLLDIFVLGAGNLASLAVRFRAFVESLLCKYPSLYVLKALEVHHVHRLGVVASGDSHARNALSGASWASLRASLPTLGTTASSIPCLPRHGLLHSHLSSALWHLLLSVGFLLASLRVTTDHWPPAASQR